MVIMFQVKLLYEKYIDYVMSSECKKYTVSEYWNKLIESEECATRASFVSNNNIIIIHSASYLWL